tara:strand:+ start:2728 stop:3732 length:1005 start_codon:yes stop_codon:yes gene_type:complete
MSQSEHWQEIFLTNPTSDEPHEDFVAPMMSVQVRPDNRPSSSTTLSPVAIPVTGGSNWLMFSFPELDNNELWSWWTANSKPLEGLVVGDMVRLGSQDAGAHTDWLTILEIVVVPAIHFIESIHLGIDVRVSGDYVSVTGEAAKCFRVNQSIDATSVPSFSTGEAWLNLNSQTTPTPAYSLETRSSVRIGQELYCPMYKLRRWSEIKLRMPSDVKSVCALKLMGYMMVNKRVVGMHQQHDIEDDDWFALRFKEINGNVLSNNTTANSSFHVMRTRNANAATGSNQIWEFDPTGLACSTFTPRNLATLSVEVLDRKGQPAHFGRLHLWLKVLPTGC